jgi:hypothetical protein
MVGGDPELARSKVLDLYLDPTQRFMTMLTTSAKLATVLAYMRWQILRSEGSVLAYSDHPVTCPLYQLSRHGTRDDRRLLCDLSTSRSSMKGLGA